MILQIKIVPKATLSEHKDDDTRQELQEPEKDVPDPNQFLTPEDLERGKLPPEEILSLPMFKVWKYLYTSRATCTTTADPYPTRFGSATFTMETMLISQFSICQLDQKQFSSTL